MKMGCDWRISAFINFFTTTFYYGYSSNDLEFDSHALYTIEHKYGNKASLVPVSGLHFTELRRRFTMPHFFIIILRSEHLIDCHYFHYSAVFRPDRSVNICLPYTLHPFYTFSDLLVCDGSHTFGELLCSLKRWKTTSIFWISDSIADNLKKKCYSEKDAN